MSVEMVEVDVVSVTEDTDSAVRSDVAYSIGYKDRVEGAILDGIESGELSADELDAIVARARKASIDRDAARIEQGLKDIHRIAEEIGVKIKVEWQHKKAAKKLPAKYKDDDGNSWSGRGRVPLWLDRYVAAGRKIEEFLIAEVPA